MRALLLLLLAVVLLLPVGVATVVWFALSPQPLAIDVRELSHQDVARARAVLEQNDPRRGSPRGDRVASVTEDDLNLILAYLARKLGRGAVRLTVEEHALRLAGTVRLPGVPARPYLNLAASVTDRDGEPTVTELRVGAVSVPGVVARAVGERLADAALSRLGDDDGFERLRGALQGFELEPGRVRIAYRWEPSLLREGLLTVAQRQSLRAYHARLLALQGSSGGTPGSLAELLPPVFELARSRSEEGDPVEENRALLLVLGAWAGGRGMEVLVSNPEGRLPAFAVTLAGRRDLGQHFLVSAALAGAGDTPLAHAVGLYKEVADAQGGSGFSFTDLAADRAGTRFGDVATGSAAAARRLQERVAGGVEETDFMPRARDLPEHLDSAEFRRRYGEVGSASYRSVIEEIDRRIATCSLYRG